MQILIRNPSDFQTSLDKIKTGVCFTTGLLSFDRHTEIWMKINKKAKHDASISVIRLNDGFYREYLSDTIVYVVDIKAQIDGYKLIDK